VGVCSRTLSLIEIDKGTTYTLHDFMVLQERKSVDVKEKLATLREEVVSVVVRACQVSQCTRNLLKTCCQCIPYLFFVCLFCFFFVFFQN